MFEAGALQGLLATRSEGKLRELLPMFASAGIPVVTLTEIGLAPDAREDALEVHDTFVANALAKARWFRAASAHDLVFAEDSGLEVEILGGHPGVLSKRWCGRSDLTGHALDAANNTMLLDALRVAGADDPAMRRARYVCAAVASWRDHECVAIGEVAGVIVANPRGDSGFGYDPCFAPDELRATFAEVTSAAKAAISHRRRAFDALFAAMRRIHA